MSEYASGLTMGQCASLDKERVEHALHGELMCGEDEQGFVYAPAPREECESYIMSVIDNWYYQAKQLADSGRAVERVMARHGWHMDFMEYVNEMGKAEAEFNGDYVFEHELEELREEIREIEEGMR